jgi:hypothetical protein
LSVILRILLIAIVLLFAAHGRTCAEEINEYDLKLAYLYNFCNYIRWPKQDNARDITVGFLGEFPTDEQLKKLDGRALGAKKVVAKRVTLPDLKKPPQILFISGNDAVAKKAAQDAMKEIGMQPVLVVTEHGDATIPSTMQFVWIGENVKFSVDRADAAKRGLELNAKLLRLAVIPPPAVVVPKPASVPAPR